MICEKLSKTHLNYIIYALTKEIILIENLWKLCEKYVYIILKTKTL